MAARAAVGQPVATAGFNGKAVEEEEERRMNAMYESELDQQQRLQRENDGKEHAVNPAEAEIFDASGDSGAASVRTLDTVKVAERLLEALAIIEAEQMRVKINDATVAAAVERGEEPPTFKPNPLLLGKTLMVYTRYAMRSIPTAELEAALLMLPYSNALQLFGLLADLLDAGLSVELCCRAALFLMRIHQRTIAAGAGTGTSAQLGIIVERVCNSARTQLAGLRDSLGFNIAGLQFVQRRHNEKRLPNDVESNFGGL
jgi:U3 small nucleolar RNA-associated protein 12